MGAFVDHLLFDESAVTPAYPYLTPDQFVASKCGAVDGMTSTDDDVIDAVMDASLIVYYLTGRQFHGTRQITLRPDQYDCWPRYIDLHVWPITDIITMRYDGVNQDVADFHVDEYHYIRRDDGDVFPYFGSPYAEAGSPEDDRYDPEGGGFVFEITVEVGMQIPRLIRRATQALACNLLTEMQVGDCDLPDRVTSVSRQGVTMEVDDFVDLFRDGSTGIYPVDMALRVFNPNRLISPSFVWSPDMGGSTRHYV